MAIIAVASTMCAQTVVMFHAGAPLSGEAAQIQRLVEASGVSMQLLDAERSPDREQEIARLSRRKVLAVLLEAEALGALDPDIQARFGTPDGKPAPILIFGVNAATNQHLLDRWSEGALRGCIPLAPVKQGQTLHVFASEPWTGALSGANLPAVNSPVCRLVPANTVAKIVLENTSADSKSAAMLEVSTRHGDMVFVPSLQLFDRSWIGQPWGATQAFSSMAPYLLFLKEALGEYAWHLDGHYANLTIDDPWLTKSYGNLNYRGLLTEMEKHRFHTTIAFVPWNYDRSDPAAATLFRRNHEYFSICLHGNNHIHREFGNYADNPLDGQIADIKQGLARMEEFQRLSGVAYDRFMVFPHGVAPEDTFVALKNFGFLGTANSINVPLDQAMSSDPLFLLKPYTTLYGDLLSLARYSVEAPLPHEELAIQAFLGNPILFYTHQGYFADGITAFNGTADALNRLQPDTRWMGLGDMARHLYELRRREDGEFDVRMFSNEMTLTNQISQETTYFVSANVSQDGVEPRLMVSGTPSQFELVGSRANFRIRLKPNESTTVNLNPYAVWYPSGQDIQKTDLRASLLRYTSDFRDMRLSRYRWSRSLVSYYYAHDGESLELHIERRGYLAVLLVVLFLVLLLPILRHYKRRFRQPIRQGSGIL
jgi:hypothetical protein